ncbi:hypothetical protein FHW36_102451 [Chitinophaga polysaccharea]|uniref:Lipocalin-like protein n=1 Tax=Chitinophaga polysaccharea TaxID=1293035 RepID=A0A561PX52_9BACT|nr:hypothetical protein [Chitinophaga polysaccharea]TWF42690.1 hypothetical protein FHW36_102451 [Chitinophaga polysaccharea]
MKKSLRARLADVTLFAVAILAALFFSQCRKKDDQPNGIDKSYLINKKWSIASATVTPGIDIGQGPITDLLAVMPACFRDNFIVLKENGTGTEDEGGDKCPDADQTRSFNWSMTADGAFSGEMLDNFEGHTSVVKNDQGFTLTAVGKIDGENVIRTVVMAYKAI